MFKILAITFAMIVASAMFFGCSEESADDSGDTAVDTAVEETG